MCEFGLRGDAERACWTCAIGHLRAEGIDEERGGRMLGRRSAAEIKENVASGADLAVALARDKKFRKQLLAATSHAEAARRRAVRRTGAIAAAMRLATDEEVRQELRTVIESLRQAK